VSYKITDFSVVATPAGTLVMEGVDTADTTMDVSGTNKKWTLAALRTALLAGGTGYTAADPLVIGQVTSSGPVIAGTAGYFAWNTRSVIKSSADGLIELLNNGVTGFTRLNFGGTTASFPSLKVSGAALQVRLADDSADASLNCLHMTASGSVVAGASNAIGWNGRSNLASSVDGTIRLVNNAATGFTMLQFGGTTSSFPALKVSGASLQVRTADDSAYGDFKAKGIFTAASSVYETLATVTYSASLTPDASLGNAQSITATNATAFTINAPTNPVTGEYLEITIRNTSGGALGVATWNAVFKMTAWTQPATGFSRSIVFRYDGTNWVEKGRTTADIPN
jgi:hypothetical protein